VSAAEGRPAPLGIALLGSTGSVGESVLRVVRQHPERLKVIALAARGSDPTRLRRQVREFAPEVVAVADPEAARHLAAQLPDEVRVLGGRHAAVEAVQHPRVERVVAAMVGAAGLAPVHAALAAGKDVALANKEALVAAGPVLMAVARASGAAVLPIDSEHAALHQALRCGERDEVRRLVLTASGGPFRGRDATTFASIAPEEAMAHPTWKMGAKISVDSATLMNKGLELIEASHLFSVPEPALDVVVHPQSIVHSLVEFHDGSWIAQLSVNDMVFPVQYALSYPHRWGNDFPRLSPADLGRLDFHPVDLDKFPALGLARRALAAGGSAPAVLNAANEVAVRCFLAGEIAFPAIAEVVARVLDRHDPAPLASLEDVLAWDAWGRARAGELAATVTRT
jgi:1-deoxy-D-xylulose-5-phosphate reductoisomerase